jgi:xylulokinase
VSGLGPLLLGVDVGTASSKGVLATAGGEVVAVAERAHTTSMPQPGWFEHDPAMWWADCYAILRELAAAARGRGEVAGVGISGIGPCVLIADDDGTPLRPAILYGVDTRATAEIAELCERIGAEAMLAWGGSPLTSQAVGPKLLWLQRHEPQTFARARRFFMASSWLVHRLTGEYVLDHHSASQCNPLYDLRGAQWKDGIGIDLWGGITPPALHWPGDVAGRVTAAAAGETGLPAGTTVVAGTIDAWAEALSVGVEAPGSLMLMYGSTMFMVAAAESARADERIWQTAGVQPGSRTVAAGMATSGSVTAWLRDVTGGASFQALIEEAAATPAGADALVVLPYFAGERTPLFDPLARGTIAGLTLRHTRGHLYRAVLEGTAMGVRHNLEVFEQVGVETSVLRAVGGGTRGSLWTQIVSDVLGQPQEIPACAVGAAYGDALLAARGAGLVEPSGHWHRTAARVEPDVRIRDVYGELYGVYRTLYESTRDEVHALARLQLR